MHERPSDRESVDLSDALFLEGGHQQTLSDDDLDDLLGVGEAVLAGGEKMPEALATEFEQAPALWTAIFGIQQRLVARFDYEHEGRTHEDTLAETARINLEVARLEAHAQQLNQVADQQEQLIADTAAIRAVSARINAEAEAMQDRARELREGSPLGRWTTVLRRRR
jgi:hypothetical protein